MKYYLITLRSIRWMLVSLITIVMILGLTGCPPPPIEPVLTTQQITAINQSSQSITDALANAADPNSDAALQAAKQQAESMPNVESAVVTDGNLSVKYKNGGVEIWGSDTPLPVTPPDISDVNAFARKITKSLAQSRTTIGTKKAVIINAIYDDPAFDIADDVLNDLHDILEGSGIETTMLLGTQANMSALRNLQGVSLIIQFGHGGFGSSNLSSNPYTVQIGTEWNDNYSKLAEWKDGRIVRAHIHWGATNEERENGPGKDFVGITGKFWENAYKDNHFKDGLFFNLACSSSKYPSYQDSLKSVGIKLYSGWSEDQSKSYWTAYRILMLMADGKTMQQAVDTIPDWYKFDDPASFWYGPDGERGMTLNGINDTDMQVVIDSPRNGTSTTYRTTTISGQVLPVSLCRRLSVSVNGQSSAMTFDSQGNYSQMIGLRNGSNTIIVTAQGDTKSVTEQVSVTGNFTSDLFYSELSWNTNYNDIDLHMVPVSGADGYSDDCYYSHKVSYWGGTLDVDDTNGHGPEHITARDLPDGKYLMFVHYYSTHGQTNPATVSLSVSSYGSTAKIFTLPAMTSTNDRWNVCYVNYPSGKIESINEFIPANRGRNLPDYPIKK